MPNTPLVALPFDPPRPTLAEVELTARSSELVASLVRLREYIGADGLALTPQGGFTAMPADVYRIVGAEPMPDPDGGEEPVYIDASTRFRLLLGVGIECGAIEDEGDRLVVTPDWEHEDIVVRADAALDAVLELGAMTTSIEQTMPFLMVRDAVLDGDCVAWLAGLLPDGASRDVQRVVGRAIDLCREQIGHDPFGDNGDFETWVENGLCYLVDALTWAAALTWTDRELVSTTMNGGAHWYGGGTVRLTALARHVLPDRLADAGLCVRPPAEPGQQPALALIGDVMMADGGERRGLVESWRPDLDRTAQARLVCDALLERTMAAPEIAAAFLVLEVIGSETSAPFVRQLLDTPVAEHAADFLTEHGFATVEEMRPFLGYGRLIGALASAVNEPERLCEHLVNLLDHCEAPQLMLEVIALHRTPEATMTLTAAARHLSDPRYATLVQAAERLHHEVMSEPDLDECPFDAEFAEFN